MKTSNPQTGLVVAGTAKFGKMLIEEAVQKNRDDLKGRVIATVQRKLDQLEQQRAFIAQATVTLKCFEAQVKALEGGQFIMEKSGALKFTDDNLNKQLACAVRCAQCGYEKIVIGPN